MPVTITCSECRRKLRLPDEYMGRKVRCPACQAVFTASVEPPTEAVTAAPPPPIVRPVPVLRPAPPERFGDDDERRPRPFPRRRIRVPPQSGAKSALKIVALITVPLAIVILVGGIYLLMALERRGTRDKVVIRQPAFQPQHKELWQEELRDAFQNPKLPDLEEEKIFPLPKIANPDKDLFFQGKQFDSKVITGELQRLFDAMGAASRARDGDRLASFIDADRLFDELLVQGVLPAQFRQQRGQFLAGMRATMGKSLAKQAELMTWNTSEIKQIKGLGPTEVVVIVRHYGSEGNVLKMRWWLTNQTGAWRVYDEEDLDMGLRLSTAIGSIAGGFDIPELTRISLASSTLREAMIAIAVAKDVDLADRKLQQVATAKLPNVLEAMRWLVTGLVHVHRGQNEEALSAWGKSEKYQPGMPALDFLKAVALNNLGRWSDALKHMEAYRDLLGDDANVCYELAETYRGLGRFPDAAAQYRKSLDYDRNFAEAFLGLIQALTPQDNRDDLPWRFAKFDSPHQHFERFAEDCKHAYDHETLKILCQAMRRLDPHASAPDYYDALINARSQKPKEAVALYRSALAKEKNRNVQKNYTAGFLQVMGQAGEPVDAYAVMPDASEAFRALATELKMSYRMDELKDLVDLHAKKHPDDALLPFYRGELYVDEGRYQLADKAFAAGMGKPPDDATLKVFRSSRVLARYHTGQAMSAYLEIGPKNETFGQLAFLCLDNEKLDLLQELLAAHAKTSPGDLDTLRWTCRLKVRQGLTAAAVQFFKTSLAKLIADDDRKRLVSDFLFDMVDEGKSLEAYQAVPDAKDAFEMLASDLRESGQIEDLQRLIEAHRLRQPGDIWLSFYTGEMLLEQRAWDKAALALQDSWKKAAPDLRQRIRHTVVWALYKSGKGMAAYAEVEPRKETYLQLARLLIADNNAKDLTALIEAHRPHAGDDPDIFYHQAMVKLLTKKTGEALPLLERAFKQQKQDFLRREYVREFVLHGMREGKGVEAYRLAPDKRIAFEELAREWLAKKKDTDLDDLVAEHGKNHADDPWLLVYKGELHLLRGESDKADECFAALKAKSTQRDPWHWMTRSGWLRARIKAGMAAATYLELGPGKRTFEDLAYQCSFDKNPAQLEALLAAHRKARPDSAGGPLWDLELSWLKKDYEGVVSRLTDPAQDVFKIPRNKWKTESYLVRALVKLNRPQEAIEKAEFFNKGKNGNRLLLVLAHASKGDAKHTIDLVSKLGTQRYLVEDCYRDEDLGPILRSDGFREFRERYPEPQDGNVPFGPRGYPG